MNAIADIVAKENGPPPRQETPIETAFRLELQAALASGPFGIAIAHRIQRIARAAATSIQATSGGIDASLDRDGNLQDVGEYGPGGGILMGSPTMGSRSPSARRARRSWRAPAPTTPARRST